MPWEVIKSVYLPPKSAAVVFAKTCFREEQELLYFTRIGGSRYEFFLRGHSEVYHMRSHPEGWLVSWGDDEGEDVSGKNFSESS